LFSRTLRYPGQFWQRDNKGHESIHGLKESAAFKGGFFHLSEVQELYSLMTRRRRGGHFQGKVQNPQSQPMLSRREILWTKHGQEGALRISLNFCI
jgi:hypothetical protein